MKTLVIHPADNSTSFLSKIYEGTDWTVITHGTVAQVNEAIKSHDRIICLGHGSPQGLFAIDQFNNGSEPRELGSRFGVNYIVGANNANLLKGKECVFIWCHAFTFLHMCKLQGFATGMFISEVAEAKYYGINATQDEIDYSNHMFAQIAQYQLRPAFPNFNAMVELYVHSNTTIPSSGVIQFNRERMGWIGRMPQIGF